MNYYSVTIKMVTFVLFYYAQRGHELLFSDFENCDFHIIYYAQRGHE